MSKRNSPIAYLMELLDISGDSLAKHLHIERTTISKWKSGARVLKMSSAYFKDIFEYFVQVNNDSGLQPLEQFFSKLYPKDDPDSPEFLWRCFCRFIQNKEFTFFQMPKTNHNVYLTNVPVYKGAEGRKRAMNDFLDYLEKLDGLQDIYIMDCDQFVWLAQDMFYLEEWFTRLSYILDRRAHRICNIHFIAGDYPEYRRFLNHTVKLVFYPNVRLFSQNDSSMKNIFPTMYLIKDKLALIGFGDSASGGDMYTSVYADSFSVRQFQAMYENILPLANTFTISDTKQNSDMIVEEIENREKIGESTYFSGPMLSFTTMSEELLLDVLSANKLCPSDQERCLNLYHTLKNSMENAPRSNSGGYFHYINDLKDALSFEKLSQHELSAFSEKKVFLTREQYIRHMRDTISLLQSNQTWCRMTLSYGNGAKMMIPVSLWLKESLWFCPIGGLEGKALFGTDSSAARLLVKLYRDVWNGSSSSTLTYPAVAKCLQSMLDEHLQRIQ